MASPISITNLSRSAKLFAKKLRKDGFTVMVDVFKTGKGGTEHYGASNVALGIEKGEMYVYVTYIADGYYDSGYGVFADMKWSEMKAGTLKLIEEETINV